MGNPSDAGRSRGELMHRIVELERQVRSLQTGRGLAAASIGSGGLRLVGGSITVDNGGNIRIRGGRLLAGDPDGVRAEITEFGYRLVNEDGETDVDLTTEGATNQIRLRGANGQDNEILLTSDGAINGRVLNVQQIVLDGQDLTALLEGNSITDPNPTGDQTNTYMAEWSQAYREDGQPNDFTPEGGLTQGWYSSLNGNQRSLIGFDTSQIQADLTGRTVTRVRVWLRYGHWYFNAGGTAILGHHSHTSEPATYSSDAENVVQSSGWPKPGSRWVEYTDAIQEWATGAKTGIVLGSGPTDSHEYYGWAYPYNHSSYPPRLEIKSSP